MVKYNSHMVKNEFNKHISNIIIIQREQILIRLSPIVVLMHPNRQSPIRQIVIGIVHTDRI